MIHYAEVLKNQFGVDYSQFSGAGAAGGLAVPLMAFCGAKIYSGIELVLSAVNIDGQLEDADLVITGEGRLDSQTICGKVPVGVAAHAKKFGIPVIAIVGSIGNNYKEVYNFGIDSVFNIQNAPMSLTEAMNNTEMLLSDCAERVMRLLMISGKK